MAELFLRIGKQLRAAEGDEISKTFEHTYHECVHLAMYVAAKAREVGHHPDIDIRWQRIRFGITTHDAGHRITDLDWHINAIAAGHGAEPVPGRRRLAASSGYPRHQSPGQGDPGLRHGRNAPRAAAQSRS